MVTRWGSCGVSTGRLLGLETQGRWLATYVDTGSDSPGLDKDGTFRWKISCVPLQPLRKAPVDRSGVLPPLAQ